MKHFNIYSFLSQPVHGSAYSYPPSSSARCVLVSLATDDIIWSRAGSKGLVHGEGGLPVRDFDSGAGRLESNGCPYLSVCGTPIHLLYRLNGKSCWRRRERLQHSIMQPHSDKSQYLSLLAADNRRRCTSLAKWACVFHQWSYTIKGRMCCTRPGLSLVAPRRANTRSTDMIRADGRDAGGERKQNTDKSCFHWIHAWNCNGRAYSTRRISITFLKITSPQSCFPLP